MAGTEDYSFYCSIENSPFWIKKVDEGAILADGASAGVGLIDDKIQQWERKLVSPPKYMNGLYFHLVLNSF